LDNVLEPVPAHVRPVIDGDQALDIAASEGFDEPSSITRTLVLYTGGGTRVDDKEDKVRHRHKNVLAWLVRLEDVCVPSFGGSGPQPCGSEAITIVINATTGNVIEAYSQG
jgi:hypothetical protein